MLLRTSRNMARRFRLDPSEGEDALQTVLGRIHASRTSAAISRSYVLRGVWNALVDTVRREENRKEVSYPDESAWGADAKEESSRKEREAWLRAIRSLSILERLIGQEQLLLLPQALQKLSPNERAGCSARFRAALEKLDADLVGLFDSYGVDLGDHVGVEALAAARGVPYGTADSWATRGENRVLESLGIKVRRSRRAAPRKGGRRPVADAGGSGEPSRGK